MSEPRLEPHKVTKPIQLLAAWLAGLVLINASFLAAARFLTEPIWIAPVLVLAAVLNVPLFLFCLFLLQTKFRPEMQEDTYYASYLDKQQAVESAKSVGIEVASLRKEVFAAHKQTLEVVEELQTLVDLSRSSEELRIRQRNSSEEFVARSSSVSASLAIARNSVEWGRYTVHINDFLPSYRQIVTELAIAGIRITHTFGSTSDLPERPRRFLLSIGVGVAAEHAQQMVKLLEPYGLDSIEYDVEDPTYGESFFIGSYAYKTAPYAPLEPVLLQELLQPQITTEQLIQRIHSRYTRTEGSRA